MFIVIPPLIRASLRPHEQLPFNGALGYAVLPVILRREWVALVASGFVAAIGANINARVWNLRAWFVGRLEDFRLFVGHLSFIHIICQ